MTNEETAFDPYLKWLGIHPKDQPPNHYRLLGIELFELDPDVISNAADARMLLIKTFQTGSNSHLSQKILNELAAAKICLLNPEQKAKYDALVLDQRKLVGTVNVAHIELQTLRGENVGLRTNIRTTEEDRDAQFKSVVALTDGIHQTVNEVKRLREREKVLAIDYSKALEVLRFFGKKPEPTLYPGPPDVDGFVLATPGGGLVEISLGEDDGLLKGHLLQVVRSAAGQGTYVGKIEVLKTDPDRSVCKIDPKYLKSNVQRGDRVFSRL